MKFLSLDRTDAPYHQTLGDYNVLGFEVYTEQDELLGKVIDVLIDEMERSYYFAVERQSLLSQRRFILPLTACKLATSQQRIYATSLNKAQIKNLPEYRRENVNRYSSTYSTGTTAKAPVEPLPVEASLPLEYSPPLESSVRVVDTQRYGTVTPSVTPVTQPAATQLTPDLETPVETNASLPVVPAPLGGAMEVNQTVPTESRRNYVPVEQHNIQLLAERLVVGRQQRKVGDVVVRKVIETQMVNVPVRREKLIVEQISPEHKPLAAIDLGRGELSQVELRRLIPGLSDDAIQSVTDSAAMPTALPTETVPVQTAMQVLQQVNQASQFKHAAVKLVFDDQELQNRYQRWLAEHKQ